MVDINCVVCNNLVKGVRANTKTCSAVCRQKLSRAYDGSSIKIKETAEFAWEAAPALAEHFRKDVYWIQRGLEACDIAGIEHSYFVNRYLNKDGTEMNDHVDICSRTVQDMWRKEGRM